VQAGTDETQANMLALKYLTDAGYDPQSMINAFERWKGQFGPTAEIRMRALTSAQAAKDTLWNTSAFDQIKARLQSSVRPSHIPTLYN
jgi:hypothetical protein